MKKLLGRWTNRFDKKAIVLMYHRIADVPYDPWQLAVSPVNFGEHLKVLKRDFNVISLDNLLDQLEQHKIEDNSVCITFDDGYTDNYISARPLLEQYELPAVIYLPTNFIASGIPFWWDELADIFFTTVILPETLNITIDGTSFCYTNSLATLSDLDIAKQHTWVWPEEPSTPRCSLYLQVWEKLLPLPYEKIEAAMVQVRSWAGYSQVADPGKLPMNLNQLQAIANHRLFSFGIHTHTHAGLPYHSLEEQMREMSICKAKLGQQFGTFSNTIAYPYGKHNGDSMQAAAQLNIRAGFTTDGSIVTATKNRYALGRMQVNNWDGATFSRYLKSWQKLS